MTDHFFGPIQKALSILIESGLTQFGLVQRGRSISWFIDFIQTRRVFRRYFFVSTECFRYNETHLIDENGSLFTVRNLEKGLSGMHEFPSQAQFNHRKLSKISTFIFTSSLSLLANPGKLIHILSLFHSPSLFNHRLVEFSRFYQ